MDRFFFFFITATISSLVWTELPDLAILFALFILGVISLIQRKPVLSGLILGICWMASVGHWQHYLQLPESVFSQNLVVQGEVNTVVKVGEVVRFNLKLHDIVLQKTLDYPDNYISQKYEGTLIRLSWRLPQFIPQQGQRVQLITRLKPPWGLANEAGFSYQTWLFSKDIKATGYVKQDDGNLILEPEISLRQHLVNLISSQELSENNREPIQSPNELSGNRWILALALGYRGDLTQSDWDILQQTGTSHLMAISGMHLGMVALWSYILIAGLVASLVYFRPNCRHWYIKRIALAGTAIMTFMFMILAGAAVPTQRAWLMVLLGFLLHYFEINWTVRRFILVSLTAFILLFPLSIFSQSFWLSFGAIVMLCFLFWRFPLRFSGNHQEFGAGWWAKIGYFIKLQFLLTLLMMPLILFLFGGVSVISPVINLLAIPLVTFILLPLALINLLLNAFNIPFAQEVLFFSSELFEWLADLLKGLAVAEIGWLDIGAWSPWACLFLIVGIGLMMLPKGLVATSLALLLLLPIVTDRIPSPSNQHWQVDVLDVGQGLSILVSRNGRAVLYDTGAAWPGGFNMVESAVLPVLQSRNIRTLDTLILSHTDNDHSGGKEQLLNNVSVAKILMSPGACQAGHKWSWQSLKFEVLWPDWQQENLITSDNNTSCVIKVSDGQFSVLLPGDIEARVERYLSKLHHQQSINLNAGVLVSPHHGSKTSSTSDFISAVSPQYGVVSAGFRNRWNMPSEAVQQRYAQQNVKLFNTATDGQVSISVRLGEGFEIKSWRKDRHKRWYLQ